MTTDDRIRPNETAVPVLHCPSADETLAFWRALGFAVIRPEQCPTETAASAARPRPAVMRPLRGRERRSTPAHVPGRGG